MCGRFALTRSPEELTRVFGLAACADLSPRAKITSATVIAVVRRAEVMQGWLGRVGLVEIR